MEEIWKDIDGKGTNKTAGGFKWMYASEYDKQNAV